MDRASRLYPNEYKNFPELQDLDLTDMDARFILKLQRFREFSKIPMVPSPIQEGWTRYDDASKTSQHYAVKRLSTAGDLFPVHRRSIDCFLSAISFPGINGIGIYTDTQLNGKPHIMIHLDIRDLSPMGKAIWVRANGRYYFKDSMYFWRVLYNIKKSLDI